MTAPISSRLYRPGWLALALAACVALAVMAFAAPAEAAKKTVQTLNLCVVKSGPEKGIVHFPGKAKCKKGEQLIQVVAVTGQGVFETLREVAKLVLAELKKGA